MKFLSICEVCLQQYYVDGDETYIPSNMKVRSRRSKNPYISNWSDWIFHVQSHCPMCREECPLAATEDLEKHTTALETTKNELTKDDDEYFE